MELTLEKIKQILELMNNMDMVSLDTAPVPDEDGDEFELNSRIASKDPSPQELLEKKDRADMVNALVYKLRPRECMVIQLRYGLIDGEPKTLEEVGKRFNLTRERVRQVEKRALIKLRKLVKQSGIKSIDDI